jgi:alpha-D-ribose 1-methylphosphonate 5-phosphate C-P lyase
MYQMMIVASEDIIGIIDKGVTDYTIFNLHNLRRILSRINNNVSYTRKTKKEDRN